MLQKASINVVTHKCFLMMLLMKKTRGQTEQHWSLVTSQPKTPNTATSWVISQHLCAFGTVHTTPGHKNTSRDQIKSVRKATRRRNSVQVFVKTVGFLGLSAVHAQNSPVLRKSTSNAWRRMFVLVKRDPRTDGSWKHAVSSSHHRAFSSALACFIAREERKKCPPIAAG